MSAAVQAAAIAPPGQRAVRSRQPTDRDVEVGRRLRQLRAEARLTLKALAQQVNVTYVQLHRYETGASRVPAGRLIEIAQALGVRVEALAGPARSLAGAGEVSALLAAFELITDVGRRAVLVGVARSLAEAERLAEQRALAGAGA